MAAELVKRLMNGQRLPNWVGLVAYVASMVWMAATAHFGGKATQAAITVSVDSLKTQLLIDRETSKRRWAEANDELKAIGKKVNHIAREIR
jgi:hypothetical protein